MQSVGFIDRLRSNSVMSGGEGHLSDIYRHGEASSFVEVSTAELRKTAIPD